MSLSLSPSRVRVRALALTLPLLAFAPAANASTSALFDLGAPGPQAADPDKATVEVGTRFTVTSAFRADGIAVYRAPGSPIVSMRAHLWDGDGLVATALTSPSAASGWVRAAFSGGPRRLTPGTEYVASYTAERGGYVATPEFFEGPLAPAGGPLRAPVDAGVFYYLNGGVAERPTDTWEHASYWVTPYGESVETTPPPAPPPANPGPWALFDASRPIATPASDDADRVEVGVRFSVDAAPTGKGYRASMVRFYRALSAGMMENRVRVYDEDGTLLADGIAMGEGPKSGTIDVSLAENVNLEPGKEYTASYLADGHYAEDQFGFADGTEIGPLNFPAEAGVYQYGSGFPTATWHATDYYVSPIVETYPLPEFDFDPPIVSFDNPTDNAVVAANTRFIINVRSTDADSENLKSGRILIDGVDYISTTALSNNSVKGYYITLTPGTHTVAARVEDAAGHVGEATITLIAR